MKKQNTIIDDEVTKLMKGYRVKQVCAVDKFTFIIMGEWIVPEDDHLLDPPYSSIVISITLHLNFVVGAVYKEGMFSFFHADGGYSKGGKRGLAMDSRGLITFFSYDPSLPNGTENHNNNSIKGTNGVKLIGDHFYIISAFRSIYKRTDPSNWKLISEKPRKLAKESRTGIINAIDGFSEQDIYMGGDKGDLWCFDGKQWRQLDPPTNWHIKNLICAEDGIVYISGEHGQLLVGRNDSWEQTISIDESDKHGVYELYSMAWFQGKLYIANGSKVFYLDKKEWKVADYIKNRGNVEKIHANEDVMIIGASHRVTFYNGENEEILYENTDWLKAQAVGSSLLNIGAGMIEEGNKLIDLLDEGKKK